MHWAVPFYAWGGSLVFPSDRVPKKNRFDLALLAENNTGAGVLQIGIGGCATNLPSTCRASAR